MPPQQDKEYLYIWQNEENILDKCSLHLPGATQPLWAADTEDCGQDRAYEANTKYILCTREGYIKQSNLKYLCIFL